MRNLLKYQGRRVKVVNIERIVIKSPIDESGDVMPGLEREIVALKICAEPVKVGKKYFDISEICDLVQDEKGYWVCSDHKKAKINKILRRYGVKYPNDLIGKKVITVDRGEYLGFEY